MTPRTPQRVQMSRRHPWRTDHPDAVIVARPTRWGNPFPLADFQPGYKVVTDAGQVLVYLTMAPETQRALATAAFRQALAGTFRPEMVSGYPSPSEIRDALAGKDLACWCPPDQPCHADVLLEIANGSTA